MEVRHIILLASVIGIVILGLVLAILALSNEKEARLKITINI